MPRHPDSPFACPTCGADSAIHESKKAGEFLRRTRICRNGHGFKTYQNGGGECFDCHIVAGVHRNTIHYRQMRQTYDRLRIVCEFYGSQKILWCLERARQRAGVMK